MIPQSIIHKCDILRKSNMVPEVLVQWDSLSKIESTWEDTKDFIKAYPDFNLEDKVIVDGDDIVMIENNVAIERVEWEEEVRGKDKLVKDPRHMAHVVEESDRQ